jgi:hypothetical protein
VNGRTSHWFRGVEDRHEGHIRAGGVDKDVRFVEADDDVNDEIEAAYRTKYEHYGASLVDPLFTPGSQRRRRSSSCRADRRQRPIGRAGLPATLSSAETSRVTTLPAPDDRAGADR